MIKMKEDMLKYIKIREKCPLCLSEDLSEGIYPHINLEFPLLPVCVGTLKENDHFVPFTICLCNDCGLIMLKNIVNPEILYKIFHSDGIGKIWDNHYNCFLELIKDYHQSGRILEIGAGQGKLVKKLLQKYSSGIEVMDPLYEGPIEGVKVHTMLFTKDSAEKLRGQFDSIVSSHTLEHFIEFKEYFENAWKVLKPNGFLFTSVPNQESNFAKGYGNQLNFEHPSICTNLHWFYLHYKYGFVIRKVSLYLDHSIQIVAQKVENPLDYKIDVKMFSEKLLNQYLGSIKERIDKIKQFAKPDKENWIFGASNFSQPLFVYGLSENYFKGVLDNSPLKHNKRLYGTNLICRKPEEIVTSGKDNLRIFLNLGQYNQEVFEQLKSLNPSVEFIFL
jgi:SAM-dependent methyltransferase